MLNDLGGSFSGATNGHVQNALVGLNFNGTIDNEGVMKDAPDVNSSVFSFNPDANTTTGSSSSSSRSSSSSSSSGGGSSEYYHSGGGLTSTVMASIIAKLPPVTPPKSGVRDDTLMRTVRLSGAYKSDVPLILPSYTRLILDGSMDALPYKLGWTVGSAGEPNMTAAMVSVQDAQMVSVEGR